MSIEKFIPTQKGLLASRINGAIDRANGNRKGRESIGYYRLSGGFKEASGRLFPFLG